MFSEKLVESINFYEECKTFVQKKLKLRIGRLTAKPMILTFQQLMILNFGEKFKVVAHQLF